MTGKTTYSEAVEQVMLHNGYYAPLKLIYKEFGKYRKFSGLTPFKTIQAVVQRDRRFSRIGLGVYALTDHLDKLPQTIAPKTNDERRGQRHATIQGMIIEIGNMKGFDTYTPDRTKIFGNKELGSLATLKEFPSFTYDKIIQSVKFVDAAWFNERGFPEKIFEVEDSTDFRGSLVKFAELQDFNTTFSLVAPVERRAKYDREVSKTAFSRISERCHFVSYPEIEEYYNASLSYHKVSNGGLL